MRSDTVNFRSPHFLLGRTLAPCSRCRSQTALIAIALPPGHLVLELDEEAQSEASAVDTWRIAAEYAFLFHVEYLAAEVQFRLRRFTRTYRAEVGSFWLNSCERCGASQDDYDLFCEPDGAFLPINESNAGLIQLLSVDAAFEATAAGYAYEPAFFNAMSR